MRTRPFPAAAQAAASGSSARRQMRLDVLPAAQRILGIDPGLHRTGYGCIEIASETNYGNPAFAFGRGEPRYLEAGLLKAKAGDPFPRRLEELYRGLSEVLAEHRPDIMVVEDLFSTYAHPRSALLMAHARGVLLLAAAHAEVPVHSFLPNEIKQVVAGNGHASKAAVQAAVRTRLRLAAAPDPPDIADALAVALCFAARQGEGG